ncbi:MAG: PP2C family serine/threonine-protein phosphatase [Pyrinomonadaceae bacterium]
MVTTATEFTSAAVSDRGLSEARPQNEDSFIELPEHGLFAVADGVGGAQAGEVASQMAVEILGEAFVNMDASADPEDTMRIALDRANEAIYQMSHDLPQLSSMATTIVAVHVSGDMATIAHVGDSRVYRIDGNGRLFRETDDHSLVEEEVRAGRLTPEQALNHPSRNVISRALGAEDTVLPDIKCVLIHPGTTFLLCSDGITRHIEDTEIEQLLNSEFGPDDVCSRMKEICFSRGAEDNLTAVVVKFPGGGPLATVEPADDADIEQVTLSGIREAPDDSTPTEPDIAIPSEVLLADDVRVEAEDHDENGLAVEVDKEITILEPAPETEAEPAVPFNYVEIAEAAPERGVSTVATAYEAEQPRDAGWGALALFLLIGIGLGAVAGYFFFGGAPKTANVPPAPAPQSSNISLTAFESTRRLVDEDPIAYLNAKAATPRTADDFFWIGRSQMLTGRTVEAKRSFEEARRLLPEFDDRSSARTMANEIAMAMAILDNRTVTDAFVKEVQSGAANANSNTAANGVPPAVNAAANRIP